MDQHFGAGLVGLGQGACQGRQMVVAVGDDGDLGHCGRSLRSITGLMLCYTPVYMDWRQTQTGERTHGPRWAHRWAPRWSQAARGGAVLSLAALLVADAGAGRLRAGDHPPAYAYAGADGDAVGGRGGGYAAAHGDARARIPPNRRPRPTVTPTPVFHVIQAGESLLGIATQYDISVAALQDANGILDPRFLQIGEQLIIPRREEVEAAAGR